MEKILLAVDGSDNSLRATEEAAKIASLLPESMIELVYVADFSKAKSDVLHTDGKEALELSRRKKLFPMEEQLQAKKITHEVVVLHGDPGTTIVEYANRNAFDLVVIGSRGLNVLQEMVLGSVSHKVMKRVNCPALIVK